MSKIILDLCGGTGSWSRPYKEAGYNVINVTLPEHDVRTYQWPDNVYGILAAPPCTMFSIARRNAKTPPDFRGGMGIVYACLNIIWGCRYQNKLAFWALENPRGLLRQFLGKPWFTFEHWEYGAKLSKKTDLWGYFNPPTKTVKSRKIEHKELDIEWQNPECPDEYKHLGLKRTEVRAITPKGFADAFFKANQ